MINWISVDDKMPNAYTDILFWSAEYNWTIGYFDGSRGIFRDPYKQEDYEISDVQYWSYLNTPNMPGGIKKG